MRSSELETGLSSNDDLIRAGGDTTTSSHSLSDRGRLGLFMPLGKSAP